MVGTDCRKTHGNKKKEAAKAQITDMFDKAKDHHYMDKVFSHSQAWITNAKNKAFARFKFQPWYGQCEPFMVFLLTGPDSKNSKIEGQAAPRGPRLLELEELMEPIKGKGKGKGTNDATNE